MAGLFKERVVSVAGAQQSRYRVVEGGLEEEVTPKVEFIHDLAVPLLGQTL